RKRVIGTRCSSSARGRARVAIGVTGAGAAVAVGGGATAAPVEVAAAGRSDDASRCARTSALVTRPLLPLGRIEDGSRSCSVMRRRAAGAMATSLLWGVFVFVLVLVLVLVLVFGPVLVFVLGLVLVFVLGLGLGLVFVLVLGLGLGLGFVLAFVLVSALFTTSASSAWCTLYEPGAGLAASSRPT